MSECGRATAVAATTTTVEKRVNQGWKVYHVDETRTENGMNTEEDSNGRLVERFK